jgi:hypothetical protein
VPELLLALPEQPLAIKPAATTSAAPATAGRRAPAVLASLLMAHGCTGGLARGRGGITHTAAGWRQPCWRAGHKSGRA